MIAPLQTALLAAGVLLVLLGAGFALWLLRRRNADVGPDGAEPQSDNSLQGPPRSEAVDAVTVTLLPKRLSLGLLNATLNYQLELANAGTGHLVGLRISLDLASAGSGMQDGVEALRGPDLKRAEVHALAHLGPGEVGEVAGQVQLPIIEAETLAQDDAVLLLPLVRLRVVGAGTPVRRFAFVIGLPSGREEGLLRPIRLDAGPKIYTDLAARPIG